MGIAGEEERGLGEEGERLGERRAGREDCNPRGDADSRWPGEREGRRGRRWGEGEWRRGEVERRRRGDGERLRRGE